MLPYVLMARHSGKSMARKHCPKDQLPACLNFSFGHKKSYWTAAFRHAQSAACILKTWLTMLNSQGICHFPCSILLLTPTCCRVSAMRGCELEEEASRGPAASLDPRGLAGSAASAGLGFDILGLRAAPSAPDASLDPRVLAGSAGSASLLFETLGLRAAPSGTSANRVHCCSEEPLPECQGFPALLRPARLGKSLSKGGCNTQTFCLTLQSV